MNSIFKGPLPPYASLLHQRATGQPTSPDELATAQQNVCKAGLTNRFIYQINKEDRLVGYLIGTFHCCNEAMATDSLLRETVKRCSHLILESIEKSTAKKPDEYITAERLGMHFFMEEALITAARETTISYSGLETAEELQETMTAPQTQTPFLAERGTVLWMRSHSAEESLLENLECYQAADAQQLYSYLKNLTSPTTLERLIYKRNRKWVQGSDSQPGLIHRLKTLNVDEKPLCIAVGVGHLLGPANSEGLIALLRRAEFKVERISTLPSLPLISPSEPPSSILVSASWKRYACLGIAALISSIVIAAFLSSNVSKQS